MTRHWEAPSSLTRPPRPAGAPQSGKQARSASKRLVLPGPPPSVRGSRNLQMYPKKTHTKPTEKIPLELRTKTTRRPLNRPLTQKTPFSASFWPNDVIAPVWTTRQDLV